MTDGRVSPATVANGCVSPVTVTNGCVSPPAGHFTTCATLLRLGADPRVQDAKGRSALLSAVQRGAPAPAPAPAPLPSEVADQLICN